MAASDEKIGMLIEGQQRQDKAIEQIAADVKSLLGTRNKTYGAVSVISIMTSFITGLLVKIWDTQ